MAPRSFGPPLRYLGPPRSQLPLPPGLRGGGPQPPKRSLARQPFPPSSRHLGPHHPRLEDQRTATNFPPFPHQPPPAPHAGSRVRTDLSFKDALLTPPPTSTYSAKRPLSIPYSSLPLNPPKYLLNPSLRGRCFRCFELGHRAAFCRDPRRCLLCMRFGHLAARCAASPRRHQQMASSSARPPRRDMVEGPSSGNQPLLEHPSVLRSDLACRPLLADAFLPLRHSPPGSPPLIARVALAEVRGPNAGDAYLLIPQGLAARFGGSSEDYSVAKSEGSLLAVFFPNWVTRESAVGRSPFSFEGLTCWFSNWFERAELPRGHLRHKVWIKLRHWPLECWNKEDVLAAVSGFGELWEIDAASESREDVSFFQIQIRCRDVASIPEALLLMVEDRRFRIPIEIETWEDATPIFLGEALNSRLGLETTEAQDRFIRSTGFSSIPASGPEEQLRRAPPTLDRSDPHRRCPENVLGDGIGRSVPPPGCGTVQPEGAGFSNSNPSPSSVTVPSPSPCHDRDRAILSRPARDPPTVPARDPPTVPTTADFSSADLPLSGPVFVGPDLSAPPAQSPPYLPGPEQTGADNGTLGPKSGGPLRPSSVTNSPQMAVGPEKLFPLEAAKLNHFGKVPAKGSPVLPDPLLSSPLSPLPPTIFRRSSRLASKSRGICKTSLQRAQDLLSSKLLTAKSKFRRSEMESLSFSPPPALPPSSAVSTPDALLSRIQDPADTAALQAAPLITAKARSASLDLLAGPEKTASLDIPSGPEKTSPHPRDPTLPLSAREVNVILAACGIVASDLETEKEFVSEQQRGVALARPAPHGV